ncbi:type ISP restriction/modification enzyme [Chryseobacterium sp.]|uniref:type ISP restriction/modification enzyme n=1 Tax=Chryseobacterium sp. TaxID=1871047 RepID=UPI001E561BAA|nr:type ISP restriction/modification enzyme [Chryseobacterium sp.]
MKKRGNNSSARPRRRYFPRSVVAFSKEENVVEKLPTPLKATGSERSSAQGTVTEALEAVGRVYSSAAQYFDNIPENAQNFYIGGYQPAQKWLKDRKRRTLDFQDVLHYQKMIYAVSNTERLMEEIDEAGVI